MAERSFDADINKVLRHHDSQLASLTVEVGSIKTSVSQQGQILQEIRSGLSDIRGNQGPGLGKLLGIVLSGGALMGMAAAAITVLVTSFVAPDITKLKTDATRTEKSIEYRDAEDRKELFEHRRKLVDRVEKRIESLATSVERLNERTQWLPSSPTPARR